MVDNLVVVCDGAEFCMRWPVESDPSNIATEYEIRLAPPYFLDACKCGGFLQRVASFEASQLIA